jgi:hypothetical protein
MDCEGWGMKDIDRLVDQYKGSQELEELHCEMLNKT